MKSKKVLALLLALTMVLTMMPGLAFAETDGTVTDPANGTTTDTNTDEGTDANTGGNDADTDKDGDTPSDPVTPPPAVTFVDMPNNWSTQALQNAVANGLINGYDVNGQKYIKPAGNLSRAEMAAIVNRAFGATETAALTGVTDVPASAWFAADMQKAAKMGTFMLDTRMRPSDSITRQEAFTVLARAFSLTSTDENHGALDKFSDKNSIATWAADSLCALAEKGYVSGSNGKLNPLANISRAEFAQIMDNMLKQYIKAAGTVTTVTASGNVMINAAGVTLKDVTINGDLILGDGINDGAIVLENVKVTGRVLVRGGGATDAVIIKGTSDVKSVVVAKVDGDVRVAVQDSAKVGTMDVVNGNDNVVVEGAVSKLIISGANITVTGTSATIGDAEITGENSKLILAKGSSVTTATVSGKGGIEIQEGAKASTINVESADADVTVAGTVTDLNVNAPAEVAVADTGAVTTLNVSEEAEGANVDMAKNAKVSTINAKANMTTSGAGKPGKITAPEGVTVTEKESGKPEDTTTPPSGGSSGGSSKSPYLKLDGTVTITGKDGVAKTYDAADKLFGLSKDWTYEDSITARVIGGNFTEKDDYEYDMQVVVEPSTDGVTLTFDHAVKGKLLNRTSDITEDDVFAKLIELQIMSEDDIKMYSAAWTKWANEDGRKTGPTEGDTITVTIKIKDSSKALWSAKFYVLGDEDK